MCLDALNCGGADVGVERMLYESWAARALQQGPHLSSSCTSAEGGRRRPEMMAELSRTVVVCGLIHVGVRFQS